MVLHGSARFTDDLDICYAGDSPNLDALGRALIELEATRRRIEDLVPFVPDGVTLRRMEILTLGTRAGPLDLLLRPPGAPPYPEMRARAERLDLDGVPVLIASLDDLAAMKRAAGRDQDRMDLEIIRAIRQSRS